MNAAGLRAWFAKESLALRIAASSAFLGLVVVGLAMAGGYLALSRQLQERQVVVLEGKHDLLEHLLGETAGVEDIPSQAYRFADLLIGHDDLHMALVEPRDSRLLASFSPLGAESIRRLAATQQPALTRWQSASGRSYASLSGTSQTLDGQRIRFVLSLDLQADQGVLAGYIRTSAVGLPALLLLIAAGAWAIARTGLLPLQRFARLASSIKSNALSPRINTAELPTELAELAAAFNAMLDRIAEGMARLSEFSADLAHEMRTPVATLLGRSQVALSRRRSAGELQEVLAGNVDELDRLTRLIADMLFLAHADQGAAALDKTEVNVADEARRIADFLSVLAEDRGVIVRVSGAAVVQADALLIQRAITNLLTNAIRHADEGSTVSVAAHGGAGSATLAVINQGQPIAPDQLNHVFERFVRLDAARGRTDGGSGLGLAIVKSIMQAHGGNADASSSQDGVTVFRLLFPTV